MDFQKPKGTNDILGKDILIWQKIESILKKQCQNFGFFEIRTPIFEQEALFKRGVGGTSDIVQKEMFCFEDRGKRKYALKPEGTASVARAFIENKLYANPQPTKLYYISPNFRNERAQMGRFKQFYQFGTEVFGSYAPALDAEVIAFAHNIFKTFNINVKLKINSLGDTQCRQDYNTVLKQFVFKNLDNMCDDCKIRYEKKPLRILDCKNENCKQILKNAPKIIDYLEQESKKHFENLQKYLTNLKIPFEVDDKIVRGLDYYTKTVFEFISENKALTICAGGRYDNLIELYGGGKMGAVGFALGLERLILLLQDDFIIKDNYPLLYIGFIGEKGFLKAQNIAYSLRQKNIYVEYELLERSVKSQLKYANKINAKYAIVLGDEEINTNKVNLKIMDKSTEREINLDDLENEILYKE